MKPRRPVLRRKKRRWTRFIFPVLLLLALAGGALAADLLLNDARPTSPGSQSSPTYQQPQQQNTEDNQPPSIPQAATGTGVTVGLRPVEGPSLTYTQIYDKNAPSMVSIQSTGNQSYSTGTGVILTADGYIITNAHVVAEAQQVQIITFDNRSYPASLVGFDAREDLAVLKVEAEGLTPAEFGDSSTLCCGDPVAALGDSLGYRSTITDGIISALEREVRVDGVTMTLIQTSTAINLGNSGGALINQYGQVVGITTVKIVTRDGSAEAMGFAIPSRRVKYVVDALIDGRPVSTAAFGFTVLTHPEAGGGLMIQKVEPASDAYAKGLQTGDVITTVDGVPISSTQDLARIKQGLGPGDTVSLTYLRDGALQTVEIALVDADLVYG